MNETNQAEKRFYTADETGVPGIEMSKEGVITGIKVPFNDVMVILLQVLFASILISIALGVVYFFLMIFLLIIS